MEIVEKYGWLSPIGKFYPERWGRHEVWALEHIKKYFPSVNYTYILFCPSDFLIKKGWILLHSPLLGSPQISKDPIKAMTKKQKDFVYGHFMALGMKRQANEVWRGK